MKSLVFLTAIGLANAYWLMGIENVITVERIDPIVNPGRISGHAHAVLGGSNFGFNVTTEKLRQSECTSIPIPQDKSNYWYPHLYFQWKNGSFSSMNGGAVIYYLFGDTPGTTTAFPDNFRMLSGDPTLRTYDPNSFAQQAVTFLCLDFNGVTTRHNSLPLKSCPSGVRAQINFPSCWNGKDVDSPDHKSHVAFMSEGADKGSCKDPKYPKTLPRIFIEVYWSTSEWEPYRSQAMNTSQPFVYAHGDRTGYGYHADFYNGWEQGVLQKAVDNCHCNIYGDPTCCANQGIFDLTQGKQCHITKSVDEQTTGTLAKLPGNNPVQEEGTTATMHSDPNAPAILAPVCAYTSDNPPASCGKVVSSAVTGAPTATASSTPSNTVQDGKSSSYAGGSSASTGASSATDNSSASSATSTSVGSPVSTSSAATGTTSKGGVLIPTSSSAPSATSTSAGSPAGGSPVSASSAANGATSKGGVYIQTSSAAPSNTATSSSSKQSTKASSSTHNSYSASAAATHSSSVTSSSVASKPTVPSSGSGGGYNTGSGSSSNSSGGNSHSHPPAHGGTKEQSGSCDLGGAQHHQFLSNNQHHHHHHHHHHGRSLRRVRRSHH